MTDMINGQGDSNISQPFLHVSYQRGKTIAYARRTIPLLGISPFSFYKILPTAAIPPGGSFASSMQRPLQ